MCVHACVCVCVRILKKRKLIRFSHSLQLFLKHILVFSWDALFVLLKRHLLCLASCYFVCVSVWVCICLDIKEK